MVDSEWATLTRQELADVMSVLDATNDFSRPLSELVLQRKISDKDDKDEAALEVELALWEHGRKRIKQNKLVKFTRCCFLQKITSEKLSIQDKMFYSINM